MTSDNETTTGLLAKFRRQAIRNKWNKEDMHAVLQADRVGNYNYFLACLIEHGKHEQRAQREHGHH